MTADGRVALLTATLWILVAAGPVMGLLALTRTPAAAVAEGAPTPAVGVTGLAELAVAAHLSALPGQQPAGLAPAHPALRPVADPLDGVGTALRTAAVTALRTRIEHAAALTVSPAGPGRWGVTVGVLREGRLEAWQVTVAETPRGPLVETIPAAVALPPQGAPPTPSTTLLRPPAADDPLATVVTAFLDALLTDDGPLDRYLAPGSVIDRPQVRFREVQLLRVASGPVDQTRIAVLVEARAIREDGGIHLVQYPLLLQRTGARWEVQRLLPALPAQAQIP